MAASVPVPGSGHHYIGIGAETVNPADGSLTFDLPIQPPPGRQLSFPFGIHYNSEMFYISGFQNGSPTYPALNWGPIPGASNWNYNLPFLTFQATARGFSSASGQGQTFIYHQCDSTNSFIFRGLDGIQYSIWGARLGPIRTFLPTQSSAPTTAGDFQRCTAYS
jgi:hypothetical protein